MTAENRPWSVRAASEKRSVWPSARNVGLVLALSWWLLSHPASGQYISFYGTPNEDGLVRQKEQLEQSYTEARWKFGGIRVQPWAGVRDAAYVSNQTTDPQAREDNDFTVTAGAGLRAYLKAQSKLYLAAHIMPEYVWWQDNDDKSNANGRYGIGAFGFYNRLGFELSHRIHDQQVFFTPEVEVLTSLETATSRGEVEVEVIRGIYVYARATQTDIEGNTDDEAVFSLLDRSEERYGGGIRLRGSRPWTLSLGIEEATTEFEPGARNLSNDETAAVGEFTYEHSRTQLSLMVQQRELEPTVGSDFRPFDETTGGGELFWSASNRLTYFGFLGRRQAYSVSALRSSFLSDRQGAGVHFLARRVRASLHLAIGEDNYDAIDVGAADRVDDLNELGAMFSIQAGKLLRVGIQANYREYDSNIDQFDRDILTVSTTIDLSRLAERLQIGSNERTW